MAMYSQGKEVQLGHLTISVGKSGNATAKKGRNRNQRAMSDN